MALPSTDRSERVDETEDRRTYPVPDPVLWRALPASTREALAATGHDASWFRDADPVLQYTVVNLYVKLRDLDLWRFVDRESESGPGCLHFETDDLDGLRAALASDVRFTDPETRDGLGGYWQSRELRFDGALHFKHFDGWAKNRLQAHIDHTGLWVRWWWWLIPVVPLVQMLRHIIGWSSYQDVVGVRRILERQGALAVEWGEEAGGGRREAGDAAATGDDGSERTS